MAKKPVDATVVESPTDGAIPVMPTGIQQYLDKAIGALKKFGVATEKQPT
jgi:hypothetical protein